MWTGCQKLPRIGANGVQRGGVAAAASGSAPHYKIRLPSAQPHIVEIRQPIPSGSMCRQLQHFVRSPCALAGLRLVTWLSQNTQRTQMESSLWPACLPSFFTQFMTHCELQLTLLFVL
jgi:hypothetical protein